MIRLGRRARFRDAKGFLVLYIPSFLSLGALVLTFLYPVWDYVAGAKCGLVWPTFVPIWKAHLDQTAWFVMVIELLWVAAFAMPPYLALSEWFFRSDRRA